MNSHIDISVIIHCPSFISPGTAGNAAATEMFRGTIKEMQSSGRILPDVFFGCETWCHFGPHRWREFENRVMRKTFGPKRDDVIVEWKC
jgi:hypothetical protein